MTSQRITQQGSDRKDIFKQRPPREKNGPNSLTGKNIFVSRHQTYSRHTKDSQQKIQELIDQIEPSGSNETVSAPVKPIRCRCGIPNHQWNS